MLDVECEFAGKVAVAADEGTLVGLAGSIIPFAIEGTRSGSRRR